VVSPSSALKSDSGDLMLSHFRSTVLGQSCSAAPPRVRTAQAHQHRARHEQQQRRETKPDTVPMQEIKEAPLSHLLLLPPPAPHPVCAGVGGGRHGFPLLQAGEGMQWASRRRRRQRRARPRGQ